MTSLIRSALCAWLLSVALVSVGVAAPTCTNGKRCGDTCISKDKECRIPTVKTCKIGKLCGGSCIAQSKTCTK
jgi:hypothetical protein